jgi:hypothetical protein
LIIKFFFENEGGESSHDNKGHHRKVGLGQRDHEKSHTRGACEISEPGFKRQDRFHQIIG